MKLQNLIIIECPPQPDGVLSEKVRNAIEFACAFLKSHVTFTNAHGDLAEIVHANEAVCLEAAQHFQRTAGMTVKPMSWHQLLWDRRDVDVREILTIINSYSLDTVTLVVVVSKEMSQALVPAICERYSRHEPSVVKSPLGQLIKLKEIPVAQAM